MFHLWDNVLILSIFVFAVVMALRSLRVDTSEAETPPKNEVKDALHSSSLKDENPRVEK